MGPLRSALVAAVVLVLATGVVPSAAQVRVAQRGRYFARQPYQPHPLPQFETMRHRLPAPVVDEHPQWVKMYWKTWELAFAHFHQPSAGSGFVAPFIDAAFNQNIFLWDTAFMTMFCNYGHGLVPGIGSLDNFYAKQHDDGEICREIDRRTGTDHADWCNTEGRPLFSRWGWSAGQPGAQPDRDTPATYRGRPTPQPAPVLTLDALNNPVAAWAELESLRITGDRTRIAKVYPPLRRYHAALRKYLRQGSGLYLTDWASMDNSPRNAFLRDGGCAVDTASQMVLSARSLATMAELLGRCTEAARFEREATTLAELINRHHWDDTRQFYFDLRGDGARAPVKTVAAFWTLLADVARPEQVDGLVAQLNDPTTFRRAHRVPTLAADEPGYDPQGGYWRGAVWAPTTMMVVRGLEKQARGELAREIALNHLEMLGRVFGDTGTIWENYAPDAAMPGMPAKPDFVGWSGLGPILYLLEFAIGLRPDACRNSLFWDVRSGRAIGCERYRFGSQEVSLIAEPVQQDARKLRVSVQAAAPFALTIRHAGQQATYAVTPGRQELVVPVEHE